EEAKALVLSVGGLPLALTLMGNYLKIQEYTDQPRRLHAALNKLHRTKERFKLGQAQAPLESHPSLPEGIPLSLLASIRLSEEVLGKKERRMLRTLSVLPPKPSSFSEAAAQAISGVSIDALDTLTDCSLLESTSPRRYTLHQTISD